jgi:hypothetical protein
MVVNRGHWMGWRSDPVGELNQVEEVTAAEVTKGKVITNFLDSNSASMVNHQSAVWWILMIRCLMIYWSREQIQVDKGRPLQRTPAIQTDGLVSSNLLSDNFTIVVRPCWKRHKIIKIVLPVHMSVTLVVGVNEICLLRYIEAFVPEMLSPKLGSGKQLTWKESEDRTHSLM